jgi:hypothetical protein
MDKSMALGCRTLINCGLLHRLLSFLR